jgi:hypothetical protein
VIRTTGSVLPGTPSDRWAFFSRPLVFGLLRVSVRLIRSERQSLKETNSRFVNRATA